MVRNSILKRNYFLTRILFQLWLQSNMRGRQPLVIFQMGKVGSTTVLDSIKAAKIRMPVFHVHVLTAEGIAWEEKSYFGDRPELFRKSLFPTTRHLIESQYLHKLLKKERIHPRWKVITLIRDPVARNLSAFFQTIERRVPNFYQRYAAQDLTQEDLVSLYLDRSEEKFEAFEQPFTWFTKEFAPVLNLDVLKSDFPHARGYKSYETRIADVLLIRLEDLTGTAHGAFTDFLPLDDFALTPKNLSTQKKYNNIYQDFLQFVVLPAEHIEHMYDDRYVRHFYTDQEIQRFKQKWGRTPAKNTDL